MADAAAARREARRRKILENSQTRLQRISGKCEEPIPNESSFKTILPNVNCEDLATSSSGTTSRSNNFFNNGVVVTEAPPVAVSPPSPIYEADAAGDSFTDVANDLAALMSPGSQPANTQQVTVLEKLVLYKYDVVLVSLLVQLLYSFSLLTFDETYFFLPLVVYIVTKIIWFPAPSSSNFANALLLLNGISAQRVERITSVMRWVSIFSQDVCVYLFTMICMQALTQTITNSLIT
ncbi:uncharacterized protein LOC125230907 [Leguminivora glycinivorella]|uniref:uncharacterized protein LOC125230907 n=1 Tax=Leguminivora glycinivorella TaxID=1035111 RepID=UPI00200C77FF|nr:uncharacterized protein LOC125230907 [Leguminivora glycinivorella]